MWEDKIAFRDEVKETDLQKTKRFFDELGITYVIFGEDKIDATLYLTGDYHEDVKYLPEDKIRREYDLNFWEFENGKLVSY